MAIVNSMGRLSLCRHTAGPAVIGVFALFSSPLLARTADPYAYELQITPMEGPLNPQVERRYTADFNSCQKRAVSTPQNEACLEAEFDRQDAALNHAWKAVMARVPASRRKALVAAERKWSQQRDPFCRSNANSLGGTIGPVAYLSCRTELTIRRAIWLEKLH